MKIIERTKDILHFLQYTNAYRYFPFSKKFIYRNIYIEIICLMQIYLRREVTLER